MTQLLLYHVARQPDSISRLRRDEQEIKKGGGGGGMKSTLKTRLHRTGWLGTGMQIYAHLKVKAAPPNPVSDKS